MSACGRDFCRSEVPAFFQESDNFCDTCFVCLSGERVWGECKCGDRCVWQGLLPI